MENLKVNLSLVFPDLSVGAKYSDDKRKFYTYVNNKLTLKIRGEKETHHNFNVRVGDVIVCKRLYGGYVDSIFTYRVGAKYAILEKSRLDVYGDPGTKKIAVDFKEENSLQVLSHIEYHSIEGFE